MGPYPRSCLLRLSKESVVSVRYATALSRTSRTPPPATTPLHGPAPPATGGTLLSASAKCLLAFLSAFFDATLPRCYPFSRESLRFHRRLSMGQVQVQVILTNYREAVLARLGQLDASQVHRYETEALIDTGAVRSVLPPAVADRLGLLRLDRTEAKYANSGVEEVDVTEA